MLPTISVATYTTNLISDNRKIEFRPFLAKEQKSLLMAIEGNDIKEIVHSVMNVLKACILTPNIDVFKLPSFDIQHLFLELRKRSVEEIIELKMHHPESDHTECEHAQKITLNLNSVTVERDPEHTKKIKLNDDIGVVMRYPNSNMFEKYAGGSVENVFGLISECVESVFDKENVYSDFTVPEIAKWLEQLTPEQLQMITHFFHTMPSLHFDIKYKCKGCGQDVAHRLEGLSDFFI